MESNLPSSFSRPSYGGTVSPPRVSPPMQQSVPPRVSPPPGASSDNGMPMILSVIALVIALIAAYGAFMADRPLSLGQREQIASIADDIRALQEREITMTAPLETTIYLNKTYPVRDMFPETFEIPLDFEIPIDTQLVAMSTTGQPVAFRVQENVPIKVRIPIKSAKAFGNNTIQITKEMPLETTWSSSIRVRAAYGQDLNKIIDKLDALAGVNSG